MKTKGSMIWAKVNKHMQNWLWVSNNYIVIINVEYIVLWNPQISRDPFFQILIIYASIIFQFYKETFFKIDNEVWIMCHILCGPKICGLQYQGKPLILIPTKCDDLFIILNILFDECFKHRKLDPKCWTMRVKKCRETRATSTLGPPAISQGSGSCLSKSVR